jgi:eukaryotic-like serine/threonine-protein kinase
MLASRKRSPLRTVGRYVLKDEIASGGMATVYLGKLQGPVGFAPIVAVKALHPQFAKEPEFARMFLDEARLAARVRHANIVPVLDVHEGEDELLIVLEYIHGDSLSRLLTASRQDGRPVPPAIASAVLCDTLQGLHAAHEARDERGEPLGVVHRDVSPQNILVGVDGVARVFDFGVAKAAGRVTFTRDGEVKGKFAYMAPEHLRGEEVNRQADVYAAAVVLWEMLTGQRLFKAESEGNTIARALFAPIPPPSTFRREVTAALDAVVMRGLARERSQRFGTAKEMALALEAALAPAPGPNVGEWVEGLAYDVLEERSARIAEIEANVAASASLSSRRVAAGPSPTVGDEGTTSGQAVPESPEIVAPLASHARPSRGGAAARLIVVGVVALAALGAWFALRHRAGIAIDRPPAAEAVATAPAAPPPEAPTVASASASAAAPADSTTTSSSVALSAVPKPATTARGRGAPKRAASGAAAASASASPPPADCTTRNADGVVVFDTNCLRSGAKK